MGYKKFTLEQDAFFLEECKKKEAFSRNTAGWFLSDLNPKVVEIAELLTKKFGVERSAKSLANRWHHIKREYNGDTRLAYESIMAQLDMQQLHNQTVADDKLKKVDMMLIDPKAFRRYLADMSPEEAMVKAQIA